MHGTETAAFTVGDRVECQPPYGTDMTGIVLRVRQLPATGRKVCRVEWDGGPLSWEWAADLVPATA